MTAPGAGDATSSGTCTAKTPCFICNLKATVASHGLQADFPDTPFFINLVGIRRAESISDKFDDRLVAFFTLPQADARKTLLDGGIEVAFLDDINAAAKAMNDNLMAGRGARVVQCSRVAIELGREVAGHRVVMMYNITTDPGLIRSPEKGKKLKDLVAKWTKCVAELQEGRKKLTQTLLPALNAAGEKVNNLPKPAKGAAKSTELADAEKALKQARADVDALAKALKVKAGTAKLIDSAIVSAQKELDKAKASLNIWEDPKMTSKEQENHSVTYMYWGKYGWQGDNLALFPLGHFKDYYAFGQHHGNEDKGAVALTVGNFLGKRTVTGFALKLYFADMMISPRDQRGAVATQPHEAERAKLKNEQKSALKVFDNAKPRPADYQEKRKALVTKQQQEVAALKTKHARARMPATQEYVVVSKHVVHEGIAVPANTWVVQECEVTTAQGAKALYDNDEFEIEGDSIGKRTGRDVRLHYFELAGQTPDVGLKIKAHYPAAGHAAVPVGSTVKRKVVVFERNGKLEAIRDDDQFEVEAQIGGTNMHRGHSLVITGDTRSAANENQNKVSNWSTGCQVFWAFVEFNFFILSCGLSKRWRCIEAKKRNTCTRVTFGTDTSPDPTVYDNASTNFAYISRATIDAIVAHKKTLQSEATSVESTLKSTLDAWYKAQNTKRPAEDDAAVTQMAGSLEERLKNRTDPESDEYNQVQKQWEDLEGLRANVAATTRLVQEVSEWHKLVKGAAKTYREVAEKFTEIVLEINKIVADFGGLSATTKTAVNEILKLIESSPTKVKIACHERGVKLSHDWMRVCDLAAPECSIRFNYTLIELVGTDGAGNVASVSKLDADFARKVDQSDVYPLWSGFTAS